MSLLELKQVVKSYGTGEKCTHVLKQADFLVNQAEMVAIMGPSGSGKTTLLNIMTGIDQADEGRVLFHGKDLSVMSGEERAQFRRTKMGLVFQDFQLLDSLNVSENILLPLILDHQTEKIQREELNQILQQLSMQDIAKKSIADLSGGQKQKVAIGSAMIHRPSIVFADEPTGNLDVRTTGIGMKSMRMMNQQFHSAFVIVTHDTYTASFCDRVLLLQNGRIQKEVNRGEKGKEELVVFRNEIVDMLRMLGGIEDDLL